MASLPGRISPLKYLSATIEVEPVYNMLNSLALLNVVGDLPHLNGWALRTFEAMSLERRQTHRLVFEALGYALSPMQCWPDFPTYLENLAATDPVLLRDRILMRLTHPLAGPLEYGTFTASVDALSLLNNVQAYLAHVRLLNPKLVLDVELYTQAHTLLTTPDELQATIVAHLKLMWKAALAPEWKRIQNTLQSQVHVYEQRIDPDATAAETFRLFTGRDLLKSLPLRNTAIEQVILVPSLHTGRYVTQWLDAGTLHLFFSAPPDFALILRQAQLGYNELHVRLKTLADVLSDETRLRILELFILNDELMAQDIMERLDVSQSSVSRHLKHLVGAGYLFERREGANKVYTFNTLSFDSTIHALELLKAGETILVEANPSDVREELPRELRRFLDQQGRVVNWPPQRRKDRLRILDYLISKFESGQLYSEKEVQELLSHYLTFRDQAALQSELCDLGLLIQEGDGDQYRRR